MEIKSLAGKAGKVYTHTHTQKKRKLKQTTAKCIKHPNLCPQTIDKDCTKQLKILVYTVTF